MPRAALRARCDGLSVGTQAAVPGGRAESDFELKERSIEGTPPAAALLNGCVATLPYLGVSWPLTGGRHTLLCAVRSRCRREIGACLTISRSLAPLALPSRRYLNRAAEVPTEPTAVQLQSADHLGIPFGVLTRGGGSYGGTAGGGTGRWGDLSSLLKPAEDYAAGGAGIAERF